MFSPSTHAPFFKRLPSVFYKLAAQSWIDFKWPRHLFVEICAGCNLACNFCPRDQGQENMPWELFTQIIDEGSHYGPRSYSLHLFNEPMLSPYWSKAIRYVHSTNCRNKVLLTTNGTAINAKVDELIDANPDQVFWTWRPEARFTSSTREKLRKWKRLRVRFIEEVTPKEAYKEWADWKNVEGRQLHNYGGNIDLKLWSAISENPMGPKPTSKMRWPCYHLWLAPAVAWNGNLLLCCADAHQKEVLGHFPEMSVHQAWKSPKLQAIRESHLQGNYMGICKGCDVWKQYPDLFFSWQKRFSS